MHRQLHRCGLGKWNGPGSKNPEHDCERDKMRRVQQQPPIPGLPKNSQRDAVEKYEKSGTLCEHAEPEKSRGRNPNQPRGFLLSPKTQPKNDGKAGKRNVQRFNLDQPALLYHSNIRQPNERCYCRSTWSKACARDGHKRDRHCEHSKS